MQFTLPIQSERDAIIDQAFELIRRTQTRVLISYLPVLARHADPLHQAPPLRFLPVDDHDQASSLFGPTPES